MAIEQVKNANAQELPIGIAKKTVDLKKQAEAKLVDTPFWTFPPNKVENPFPEKLFTTTPKENTNESEKFLNIKVKKGTWFSKIAMSAYDLEPEELVKASKIIADYNGIKDIDKIKIGTVLKVPMSIKIGDKEYSVPTGHADDVEKNVEVHRTLIHAKPTKTKNIKTSVSEKKTTEAPEEKSPFVAVLPEFAKEKIETPNVNNKNYYVDFEKAEAPKPKSKLITAKDNQFADKKTATISQEGTKMTLLKNMNIVNMNTKSKKKLNFHIVDPLGVRLDKYKKNKPEAEIKTKTTLTPDSDGYYVLSGSAPESNRYSSSFLPAPEDNKITTKNMHVAEKPNVVFAYKHTTKPKMRTKFELIFDGKMPQSRN